MIGAVLVSNLLFSCDDGSGKGFHGWLRISLFSLEVRKARRASLLDAVSGSQRARYAISQVLIVLGTVLRPIKVNIHKLLLAFEALAKVELGRLDGGHGCAAVRGLEIS